MTKPDEKDQEAEMMARRQQEQMLRLVTKGFYNELINYGVRKPDILTIASHLLDHVMQQDESVNKQAPYYNRYFTTASLRDEWAEARKLTVHEVHLEPVSMTLLPQIASWLSTPAARTNFITPFPTEAEALTQYFGDASRSYFCIYYRNEPVGLIGAENIDPTSRRLAMRKLIGNRDLRGKGIGKRATFAFLYYVFMILGFEKVYVHSTDVNIRNLNLNSQFGFQLEGVLLQEIVVEGQRRDMVRMGLMRSRWREIFDVETRSP